MSSGEPNLVDRLIGYVSPSAGAKRLRARQELAARLRRYEGADRGRRTAGWRTSSSSANTELLGDLTLLRNRSRDLVRNNPWASRAVSVWTSNVVEKGIHPRAVAIPGEAGQGRRNLDRADALWARWAGSTDCDADGRHTFAGLERLVQREVVEAGECFVRRRFRRSRGRLAVPLQLQVLEADHLDTMKDGVLEGGGRIVQGIEMNSIGRRVAYWLFPDHPGDVGYASRLRWTSVRVPASDILHVYRCDRAGQLRGVPWGAPSILTLRDFDEYVDAELVRVKIAASYVGFVHDLEAGDIDPATAMDDEDGERDGSLALEPGTWEFLPDGKSITFSKPPEVDALPDYARVSLRKVASGYGVPYEALTGDLSGLSFSGGRIGRLDFRASVEEWQTLGLVPLLCDPVWRWFVTAGTAFTDDLPAPVAAEWTCPPARMIEPSREIAAQTAAVKGGILSLSEVIRRHGLNPDRVFEELERDTVRAAEAGLTLSTVQLAQPVEDDGADDGTPDDRVDGDDAERSSPVDA